YRKDALARRSDELPMRMKAQQVVTAMLRQQGAIGDVLGSKPHQREGWHGRQTQMAGDVERANEIAAAVANRRSAAGQGSIFEKEMLVLGDEDRLARDKTSAHTICTLLGLTPDRPFAQSAAPGNLVKAGRAGVAENHALTIREHDTHGRIQQTSEAGHLD